MGWRFRKSRNFGPLRINLSKSGIGWSVGGKGLRFTKKASGGYRTTASIPGTGVSYVKEHHPKSSGIEDTTRSAFPPQQDVTAGEMANAEGKKDSKAPFAFILCVSLCLLFVLIVAFAYYFYQNTQLEDISDIAASDFSEDAVWYPASNISFIAVPDGAHPGETVGLRIKGKPNRPYLISVYADDEPMQDIALVPTESNLRGYVTWIWDVPEDAEPGIYYIRVSDRLGNANCVDYAILNEAGDIIGEPPLRFDTEEGFETSSFEIEFAPGGSDLPVAERVYVTDAGTKYHRQGCSHLTKSSIETDRYSAEADGYTPCKACNP